MSTVPAAAPRDRAPAPAGGSSLGMDVATWRRGCPIWTLLGSGLILVAIVFSAWWYWHETRPLADLRTIELWIGNQRYRLASKELREHLRRTPNDGAARIMLARVLAASGDLSSCTKELHEVPSWWPRKAEALYREGQAYRLMNRAREAEAALLAVIDDDPLHPADPAVFHDGGQELLSLYATEDRWDNAHKILWKLYDRATPDDRPSVLAMRIHSELERIAPTESVKHLTLYVAADPGDWEARRALAKAELALGQHSEALRDMSACLDARPDNPRVWLDYLTMLKSLGERDVFNTVLSSAPSLAETEPDLWLFRGQARELAGDWSAAAAQYRRALKLNPNLLSATTAWPTSKVDSATPSRPPHIASGGRN